LQWSVRCRQQLRDLAKFLGQLIRWGENDSWQYLYEQGIDLIDAIMKSSMLKSD